jgi:hypothetical protein
MEDTESYTADDTDDTADTDSLYNFFDKRDTGDTSPSQRLPEGEQETVAAASTTAAYQSQYGSTTRVISTIVHDSTRQANTMLMSEKKTPHDSNLKTADQSVYGHTTTPARNSTDDYSTRQAETTLLMSDHKTPLKSNVNTPAENTVTFIPLLPPIQLSLATVVESNKETWICHRCEEEVAYAKKRCKCGSWKGGARGPTKKQTKNEVKKAPKYKKNKESTSNAGQKEAT